METKENKEKKEIKIISKSEIRKRMKKLNEKERMYMSMMLPQYGVLYIKSKPGVAKSAIFRTIAEKMGFQFIDIRLSMADESDMQFPTLSFSEELKRNIVEYAIPEWAVKSNERPTIIFFDEINRGQKYVRDAALKILLEREIGIDYKFNGNVFMACAGNLGEADYTDVEEFDAALNNRLIHFEHELTVQEWVNWAKESQTIHPDILGYIEAHSEHMYSINNEEQVAYATPRSWHFLSDYIVENYGGGPKEDEEGNIITDDNGEPEFFVDGYHTDNKGKVLKDNNGVPIRNWGNKQDYIDNISMIVSGYIGNAVSNKFLRYLRDMIKINIHDIVNDYKRVESDVINSDNSRHIEWMNELQNLDESEWNGKQVSNVISFLGRVPDESRFNYILHLIDKHDHPEQVKQVAKITKAFDDLERIQKQNDEN